MAKIEVEFDLENLSYELANQLNHAALTQFIMDIDELVCERSFTEELIKRLASTLTED